MFGSVAGFGAKLWKCKISILGDNNVEEAKALLADWVRQNEFEFNDGCQVNVAVERSPATELIYRTLGQLKRTLENLTKNMTFLYEVDWKDRVISFQKDKQDVLRPGIKVTELEGIQVVDEVLTGVGLSAEMLHTNWRRLN